MAMSVEQRRIEFYQPQVSEPYASSSVKSCLEFESCEGVEVEKNGCRTVPGPLIPGLPEDLALSCLLRLSLPEQAVARSVSRSWRAAMSNHGYLSTRRAMGIAEAWLFVLAYHRVSGQIQWQALDPVRRLYYVLPAMPCAERVCPPGFGCASIAASGVLYVCGGMRSDIDCPMDSVLKFETYRNRWSTAGRMGTPRSFFASVTIDGRIYAAGGSSVAPSSDLSSAEAYDPAADEWRPVADMGASMSRYDAAVLDGKLHMTEGWSWPFHFSPRGQIYDPKLDRWADMSVGMREGWTGLSVVLDNHLFIISDHGNSKLKFYDAKSDSWSHVAGPPIPAELQRPFSVNTIDGKLYVVARSLHVAVGTVSYNANAVSVEWEVIQAPEAFSDFVPSNSQKHAPEGLQPQERTSFRFKAMPDVRVIYSSKGASIQKIQTVQNILIERNSEGQYFRGVEFCNHNPNRHAEQVHNPETFL